MKKKILNATYLVVALGTLMFVQSCKKDNDAGYKIYATIQQYEGSKVHIENSTSPRPYSCWDEGDEVRMHSYTGTITRDGDNYYILFDSRFAQWGSHGQSHGTYAALYPTYFAKDENAASRMFEAYLNSDGDPNIFGIHLEPTQLYEPSSSGSGYQKLMAPMVAVLPGGDYSTTDPDYPAPTMQFKNVCAMMEVTVNTSEPIVVTRIEVENYGVGNGARHSGRPLWGDFEITFDNNWNPILREESDITEDLAAKYITKEVTLECEHHGDEGGVSISSGSHPFYIYLPPVGYDNLHVTVYAKKLVGNVYQERCTTLISNKCSTFVANTIYPLSVTYSDSWTLVPRSHDLGPFTVNASGKQIEFSFSNLHHDNEGYFFPPYQYDFIGYHDANGDHDHVEYSNLQSVLAAEASNGWTILTGDEWSYLLNNRRRIVDGVATDIPRFVSAIVASVPGFILFPDNYPATDATLPTLTGVNVKTTHYTANRLNIPDFYKLENVGCVFLPCVYYGNGDAASIQDHGPYWGKAPSEESYPSIITFDEGSEMNPSDVTDGNGTAFIRLVTNYHPSSK